MTMDWELGRAQGGRYPTVATGDSQPQPGDTRVIGTGPFTQLQMWDVVASDKYGKAVYGWTSASTHYDTGTGGSGSTWRPGEYELQEADTQLAYLKYQSDLLKDQQAALSDEWQLAVMEGDLKRQMAADAEIKRNNAEIARLTEAGNQIELYSAQLTSRASLANTAANVATTASEWAANPRNEFALLKLMETGLTGGSATPLNAASYNPETMGAYGTALDQRFNDLFGGVGKQLADALAATNQVPVSAQPWYQSDPNYGSLNPNQQAIARNYSPDERGQYQNFMNMTPLARSYVTGQGGNAAPTAQQSQDVYAGLSDEGKRYVQLMAGKVPPASMAGGGKMTVNEPAGLVGLLSKRLYATIAENAPEQITITPMKEPKQDDQGGGIPGIPGFATGGTFDVQAFGRGVEDMYGGAKRRNARRAGAGYRAGDRGPGYTIDPTGYYGPIGTPISDPAYRARRAAGTPYSAPGAAPTTPTTPTTPAATGTDSPEMILAKQLAATMKPLGFDYTPTEGNYAAPTNTLVGTPWARLQNYPSILQALLAAASASGMSPEASLAERKLFQPTAPSYSGVSYGF